MNEKRNEKEEGKHGAEGRTCRRTGRWVDTSEHEHCPFCFGEREDILHGEREEFCDYRPGVDPIHFGFPFDTRRHDSG